MIYWCFLPLSIMAIIVLSVEITERFFYKKIEKKGYLYLVGSILCAIAMIVICVFIL